MQGRKHRWISRAALVGAGIGALAMGGCGEHRHGQHGGGGFDLFNSETFKEDRTMTVAHFQDSALSIVTANGSIAATREARSDVLVDVQLYGRDEERLSFATVHADRQGDGSLRVWVDWPGGKRKNNEGAHIDVQIPDAVGVEARSSNGSVKIIGLAGLARVDTSNGSVTVEDHSGPAHVSSSNGKLRLERIDGDIDAETSNGSVIITEAFGQVEADTSNGKVYISTAHSNPGPVRVSTSNGRVELDLGDGFEGILRVKTSNGKISFREIGDARLIETSKNRLEMQVGDSEVISAVRTSNASIRVSPRGED